MFFQILLPVLHGDLWIIYVVANAQNFVSFRCKEPQEKTRKDQRIKVFKALQEAAESKWNRKPSFAHREAVCVNYTHIPSFNEWIGTSSSSHKVGLLSMCFLESFNGTPLTLSMTHNARSLAWIHTIS
jgi:hypothetical protein